MTGSIPSNALIFGVVNNIRYKKPDIVYQLRLVCPLYLHFGSTPEHPEPQWLLQTYDTEKNAIRTYALKDILP